jgi:hypothetical protein
LEKSLSQSVTLIRITITFFPKMQLTGHLLMVPQNHPTSARIGCQSFQILKQSNFYLHQLLTFYNILWTTKLWCIEDQNDKKYFIQVIQTTCSTSFSSLAFWCHVISIKNPRMVDSKDNYVISKSNYLFFQQLCHFLFNNCLHPYNHLIIVLYSPTWIWKTKLTCIFSCSWYLYYFKLNLRLT